MRRERAKNYYRYGGGQLAVVQYNSTASEIRVFTVRSCVKIKKLSRWFRCGVSKWLITRVGLARFAEMTFFPVLQMMSRASEISARFVKRNKLNSLTNSILRKFVMTTGPVRVAEIR